METLGKSWTVDSDITAGPSSTPGNFVMSFPSHYSCDLMTCQIGISAVCLVGALNADMRTQTGRKTGRPAAFNADDFHRHN